MNAFKTRVKKLFLREKKCDIDQVPFMDMPKEKSRYNTSRVIGNVNLAEGRFRIKSEAKAIVDRFLSMPLP